MSILKKWAKASWETAKRHPKKTAAAIVTVAALASPFVVLPILGGIGAGVLAYREEARWDDGFLKKCWCWGKGLFYGAAGTTLLALASVVVFGSVFPEDQAGFVRASQEITATCPALKDNGGDKAKGYAYHIVSQTTVEDDKGGKSQTFKADIDYLTKVTNYKMPWLPEQPTWRTRRVTFARGANGTCEAE